jgi:phage gpG-like protein
MTNETQLDQLERLVRLIADDNELLNRANTFMQNLVNNKFDYRGRKDISAELAAKEKLNEGRHQ